MIKKIKVFKNCKHIYQILCLCNFFLMNKTSSCDYFTDIYVLSQIFYVPIVLCTAMMDRVMMVMVEDPDTA